MPFQIRCKKSHPQGQFRRGGELYTTEGIIVDDVPDAVVSDIQRHGDKSWLEVEQLAPEVDPADAQEGDEDLLDFPVSTTTEKYEALLERAAERGITFKKRPTKKQLVEALNGDNGEPVGDDGDDGE